MGCHVAGGLWHVIQDGRHFVAILDFTENWNCQKTLKMEIFEM